MSGHTASLQSVVKRKAKHLLGTKPKEIFFVFVAQKMLRLSGLAAHKFEASLQTRFETWCAGQPSWRTLLQTWFKGRLQTWQYYWLLNYSHPIGDRFEVPCLSGLF